MSATSDIVNQLPRSLRARFESLSKFVKSLVDESERRLEPAQRLTRSEVEEIQLLTLACSLRFFLREGSADAQGAANAFEKLGFGGFSVGNTLFEKDGPNVCLGDDLASAIEFILQDLPLKDIPFDSSLTHLVEQLLAEAYEKRSRN